MNRRQIVEGRAAVLPLIERAQIPVSRAEIDGMEVADFGLANWREEGAQIVTLLSTDRVGLKLICLLPGQTLPEHWHTADGNELGKEETLRVLHGEMHLCLPGGDGPKQGFIPRGKEQCYRCRDERILRQSDQITLPPDTPHWMQGGPSGCVVFSISSAATCARDPFTDPAVVRMPAIIEDIQEDAP